MKHLDITDHGTLGHKDLIKLMKKSSVWAYPCTFLETFCITGIKMQACGVLPVVHNIGALNETVSFGRKSNSMNEFVKDLYETLDNIEKFPLVMRDEMSQKTLDRWGWDKICNEWKTFMF
jgi:glycosyltransferase involved in cell wall biosynthesis